MISGSRPKASPPAFSVGNKIANLRTHAEAIAYIERQDREMERQRKLIENVAYGWFVLGLIVTAGLVMAAGYATMYLLLKLTFG